VCRVFRRDAPDLRRWIALRQMSEEPPDPLTRLGEQIAQARREQAGRRGSGRSASPQGPLGIAFRIAIELVAALGIGLAIGWGLDRVLGTRPWGLIVFFFIGAAAGMLNVFRAAKDIGRGPPPGQPQGQPQARQDRD
jgi:ATP synthase protein I